MIIPEGFGNAVFHFSLEGLARPITWSMGYQPDNAGLADPSPNAEEIRALFQLTGAPYLPGRMGNEWVYRGVTVTEMTASGPVVGAAMVDVVGTATLPPVPANCAFLLTKFTARGGRTGRGRAFLPPMGIAESNITSAGFMATGFGSIVAGEYQAAFSGCEAAGVVPYLLHSDRSPLVTPDPDKITSISISNLLATQRRRMR